METYRWLLISSLALFVGLELEAAYLPAAGPPPLRFRQKREPLSDALLSLPPLSMGAERSGSDPSEEVREPGTSSDSVGSSRSVPSGETFKNSIKLELPLPMEEPSPPSPQASLTTNVIETVSTGLESILPPQLFLQFFKQGTNTLQPETTLVVPVSFNPPRPAPRSSSAIYLSPDARDNP